MRIYIRIKIFHRLSVDDAFLIMAWLMTLANASIWQAIWDALCLSIALISGKLRVLPPDVLPESHKFLRSLYAAYLISYSSLWSVKLSFLFFFRGLGHRIKRQRIIWWAVLAFVLASYAVCIGTLDYRCLLGPVINAFGIPILLLPIKRFTNSVKWLAKDPKRCLMNMLLFDLPHHLTF